MQGTSLRVAAFAAGVSALMAACGGSDGGSPPPPPPPPPPPAPATLSVSGKAATGAAMNGATITATCATGSGTATTIADGSYSLSISGGALPCVLQASGNDSHGTATTLHSVATTTTAQITPLTELLVAQVTGDAPSALMSTTDLAALSTTFSAANVQAAQAKVVALLAAAGIDTSTLGTDSLFSASLTVGSSTGYDHVLDLLGSALATGGSTLDTLTGTVVTQASGGGGTTSASALAPELLLRPAAPSCSSLRSGSFWAVDTAATGDSGDGGGGFHRHVVDAQAGTITQVSDGTLYTLTPVDGDRCHFTVVADDGSTGDVVVSPAGVFVARGNTSQLVLVGIPQQSHTLAELAGDWNWVGIDTWDDVNTSWVYDYAQFTVTNGSGGATFQAQKGCVQASPTEAEQCFTSPVDSHELAQDSDGGFLNTPNDGQWTDKLFAYQAGNGDWFALSSTCNIASNTSCANGTGDGSLGFATRTRTLSLPKTTDPVSNSWNVYVDTTSELSQLANDTSQTIVTAVDAASGSFTRTAGSIGGATHSETLFINNPYDGFNFRDLATGVATSGGGTTTVRKSIFMKTGVGLSVIVQPITTASAKGRVVLSVAQPTD